MVRGHAKAVSQEKNAAKQAAKAKSVKRDSAETKAILEAGTTYRCSACLQGMPNISAYRTHFTNKHPKLALPAELATG